VLVLILRVAFSPRPRTCLCLENPASLGLHGRTSSGEYLLSSRESVHNRPKHKYGLCLYPRLYQQWYDFVL
jgi:hypothetical protein